MNERKKHYAIDGKSFDVAVANGNVQINEMSIPYELVKRILTDFKPTCSVKGCDGVPVAKGLCASHYSHLKVSRTIPPSAGDGVVTERLQEVLADLTKKKCSVIGCERTHHAKGYCTVHYWHFYRKRTASERKQK